MFCSSKAHLLFMMMKFSKYCATHWRRFLQKNIIRRNACQYRFMLCSHLRETHRRENMMQKQIGFFSFLDILYWYFKRKLEEISTMMDDSPDKDDMDLDDRSTCVKAGEMDIDEGHHQGKFLDEVVKNIGKVVRDLRGRGFTSMTKDAYASAIFLLLKAVPLQFSKPFSPILAILMIMIVHHLVSNHPWLHGHLHAILVLMLPQKDWFDGSYG